jgi:DNA-binding transcriptional LysR family regulator
MLKRLGASFDAVFAMQPEGSSGGDLICREKAVWAASNNGATEELHPLPLALSDRDCLFRQWATQALDQAGKAWRLAYVSSSLAAVEAIVLQGLAVTVVKGSMLGPHLRALRSGPRLPRLPGAEIRLHQAAGIAQPAKLVVEHLAQGLRSRTMERANRTSR